MTAYAVRNPRSGEVDWHFDAPDRTTLKARIAGLRTAEPGWAERGVTGRVDALRSFAAALQARRDRIVAALTIDTGRASESALEFDSTLGAIERWCNLAPQLLEPAPERAAAMPSIHLGQRLHAYPVVGVISPWNFPLLLAFVDAIPALLAGCTVALKPSEVTPRWTEPAREALAASDLAAVLAISPGGAETGIGLVETVDAVCFTGSTHTGRSVAVAAAQRLIPAFLELGGKDAAIVTEDIDIERTADALVWGSMVNAGQSCLSLERAYLFDAVADELEAALAERAEALQLNVEDPTLGQIGPVIRAEQADLIQTHFDDARARGARFLCGGRIEEHGGLWCQPTIVADTTPEMLIVREETFAPILALARVSDDEAAVAAANDTAYGLSGAVFCRDRTRAHALAERLRCGGVSVNDAALTALVHEGEKEAFGDSGLGGSRMGPAALRRFTRRQLFLECIDERRAPWWFRTAEAPATVD
ncbi:MAG: aldehyde dehydrogenase family protein [Pseudomonadota bacterium]